MLVLVSIAAAVHLLLQLTGRQQLIQAIMQFMRPFSTEAIRARFAVRMALTLEAVFQVQPLVEKVVSQQAPVKKWPLDLGRSARCVYVTVLEKSSQTNNDVITLHQAPLPAFWQWLIPCVTGYGLWAASL